jgi:hypothetical protein
LGQSLDKYLDKDSCCKEQCEINTCFM